MLFLHKSYRLKKNADFQKTYRYGIYFANRYFVLYKHKNQSLHHFRLGISISKKIGNAVERNRIKRRIKEHIRLIKDQIIGNNDIIIVVRKASKDSTFVEIQKSLNYLLAKAELIDKK